MDNIFKYENWPYFFIAIIIFLVFVNAKKCHDAGRYLTQLGSESAMTVIPVHGLNKVAAQAGAQTAAQVAQQVSEQVASKVAAQTTANVLSEAFTKKPVVKPVKVIQARSIPNTFSEGFKSVKRVAQRENFAKIDPYATKEGVNIGAAGCGCSGDGCACTICNENLNDQINLGVNNYIFPNCNNDFACMNGCNIQDQINNYQYDYYTGHSCTELERSRAGAYTSLNVDSCSQNCPSMNWMPEATASRDAAAEYIATLEPVNQPVTTSAVMQPVTLPATSVQPVNTRIESFKKK